MSWSIDRSERLHIRHCGLEMRSVESNKDQRIRAACFLHGTQGVFYIHGYTDKKKESIGNRDAFNGRLDYERPYERAFITSSAARH